MTTLSEHPFDKRGELLGEKVEGRMTEIDANGKTLVCMEIRLARPLSPAMDRAGLDGEVWTAVDEDLVAVMYKLGDYVREQFMSARDNHGW